MNEREELLNSLVLELRRGAVIIAVLSQLEKQQYGYSLVQILEEKGFAVDPGRACWRAAGTLMKAARASTTASALKAGQYIISFVRSGAVLLSGWRI
jgi:hypothetical protein